MLNSYRLHPVLQLGVALSWLGLAGFAASASDPIERDEETLLNAFIAAMKEMGFSAERHAGTSMDYVVAYRKDAPADGRPASWRIIAHIEDQGWSSYFNRDRDMRKEEMERRFEGFRAKNRTTLTEPAFGDFDPGGNAKAYWCADPLNMASIGPMAFLCCGALNINFAVTPSLTKEENDRAYATMSTEARWDYERDMKSREGKEMLPPLVTEFHRRLREKNACWCSDEAPDLDFALDPSLQIWLEPAVIGATAGGGPQTVCLRAVGERVKEGATLAVEIGPVKGGSSAQGISVLKSAESSLLQGDVREISLQVLADSKTVPGMRNASIRVKDDAGAADQGMLWIAISRPPEPGLDPPETDSTPPFKPPVVAKRAEPPPPPPDSELLAQALRLHEQGRFEDAEAAFQASIEKEPENARIWAHLAMMYAQTQEWMGAKFAWKEAVRYKPEDPAYRAGYAQALLRTGTREEAVAEARAALQLGMKPSDHPVFAELGLNTPEGRQP